VIDKQQNILDVKAFYSYQQKKCLKVCKFFLGTLDYLIILIGDEGRILLDEG
jgi:hypothetical protein